jgi:hypothetical protein
MFEKVEKLEPSLPECEWSLGTGDCGAEARYEISFLRRKLCKKHIQRLYEILKECLESERERW